MELKTYLFISLSIFVFALISKRSSEGAFTLPILFMGIGLLTSFSMPEILPFKGINEIVSFLAELTLVLVLFIDASRIDICLLKKEYKLALRLLSIGLPLTVIIGCLFAAWLLPSLGWGYALLLAVVLTPTDAALGQSVVTNKHVPVKIRESLSVESGLNDGICLPLLMISIAIAGISNEIGPSPFSWLEYAGKQLLLGAFIGVVLGVLGGKLYETLGEKKKITDTFLRISPIALAIMIFASASLIGGNGFLATFFGGIFFSYTAPTGRAVHAFAEAEGQILTIFVFLLFGFWMVPSIFSFDSWRIWTYAFMSLTIVRMVPVALSLLGLRYKWATYLFIGWFGPRGLASILYMIFLIEELGDSLGPELFQIAQVVTATVFLSVLLHGLSAASLSRIYASWSNRSLKEAKPIRPMPGKKVGTRL